MGYSHSNSSSRSFYQTFSRNFSSITFLSFPSYDFFSWYDNCFSFLLSILFYSHPSVACRSFVLISSLYPSFHPFFPCPLLIFESIHQFPFLRHILPSFEKADTISIHKLNVHLITFIIFFKLSVWYQSISRPVPNCHKLQVSLFLWLLAYRFNSS